MSNFVPKSDYLHELQARGLIYQTTDLAALDAALTAGVVTSYIGFDATADSLQLGNLIQLMRLRWLQHFGHRPIVLLGGGTTKIGDPSDKDEARPLLSAEVIGGNMEKIRVQSQRLLRFDAANSTPSANGALLVNNADWLDGIGYLDFLRDVGRHVSVNRMLTLEGVKRRLDREQNLSFLEFNYPLLQGFDFVELYRRFDCRLQMGGSDQWGNIVMGVDLCRRLVGQEVFGQTCELLTTASGAKFGKSAGNAVWLDANKTSVFDFWQYWRNTEDRDVARFLKIFTEMPLAEIARWETVQGAELNEGKKLLATKVTALVHGQDLAEQAAAAAAASYANTGGDGGAVENLPSLALTADDFAQGVTAIDLVLRAGVVTSRSEARRLIEQGGVRLDEQNLSDATVLLTADQLANNPVLGVGKKRRFRLVA
jgi:tyrosyl-tRNA synthetase